MKFSLLQMAICIGIILFIAFALINLPKNASTDTSLPQEPGATIPFMKIQMK